MNQDNELARNLRHSIEYADKKIAEEKDEIIKARMIQARENLVAELSVVKDRLRG
jgi:phosphoribosyl-ATP pyrophosphohydrolase